jgi:hypothetical protein
MIRHLLLKNLFIKTKFDGKSYKLKVFKKSLKYRFNKVNLNIFIIKNTFQKVNNNNKTIKYYPIFNKTNINDIIKNIRIFNTYTKRGLLEPSKPFLKRTGRISGYV